MMCLVLDLFCKIVLCMFVIECDVIEVGIVWWDVELFFGKLDWKCFFDLFVLCLMLEEQSFFDNEVE